MTTELTCPTQRTRNEGWCAKSDKSFSTGIVFTVFPATLLTPAWRPVHNPCPGGKLMKHTITLLLLAMTVLAAGQTQKNEPVQETKATTQALINIESKWVDALAKADTATLEDR